MTAQRAADPSAAAKSAIAAERFRNLVTEDEMQAAVESLVALKGGRVFHVRNASRAPELADMPDLLIICPPVVGIIELKSAKRAITPGQQRVADLLDDCTGLIVGIIRPWQLDELLEALA